MGHTKQLLILWCHPHTFTSCLLVISKTTIVPNITKNTSLALSLSITSMQGLDDFRLDNFIYMNGVIYIC